MVFKAGQILHHVCCFLGGEALQQSLRHEGCRDGLFLFDLAVFQRQGLACDCFQGGGVAVTRDDESGSKVVVFEGDDDGLEALSDVF